MPADQWHVPDGYAPLRGGLAWVDAGRRPAIWMVGEDAVRFVDGFTTASIAGLSAGEGCEGFFPDARGQVLAFATLFRATDGVWIDADPSGASAARESPAGSDGATGAWSLADHLERYHIRERLRIIDRSEELSAVVIAGPAAAGWLGAASAGLPPSSPFAHDLVRMEDCLSAAFPGRCGPISAVIARGEWVGPDSFLVVVARGDRERLIAFLDAAGIPEAGAAAVDAVRREEGRPLVADIPPRTLPQELSRDRRAISFRKGCYLGQETVARLDALGHVNRRLVGIVTPREIPLSVGMAVVDGAVEGIVGTITSAGPSPRFDGWLGLSIVRTAALGPDARLEVAGTRARWVPMPSAPALAE